MAKRFERQLDKATDSTLIDPNWDAIIECVDMIRGGEAPMKAAIGSIRKRYHNENPHVAHHALLVLEACMKNCGPKFHAEIATKEFMEDLKNLSLDATPDKVKNKILELLQCWAIAFKNKPEYKIVVDTHNLMKLAGFEFPEVAEADAMFIAESAPEWAEGDECYRCRCVFGLLTRKHHCRACGQIFCDKCSSKTSYLPQYGIEKSVRVCDGCYEKTPLSKGGKSTVESSSSSAKSAAMSKTEKPLPVDAKKTAEQRARELKQAEEDELNLALAISQSEAEAQEQDRQRRMYQLYNGTDCFGEPSMTNGGSPTTNDPSIYRDEESSRETLVDPELARYLNKDYWMQRKIEQKNAESDSANTNGFERRKTPTPTAPPPSESSHSRGAILAESNDSSYSIMAPSVASTHKQLDADPTPTPQFPLPEDEQTAETMEFCRQLKEQVTIMDNRIRSNIARNRSIVNDTAIQSLFVRLTEMHAQVMVRMNKLEDQRNYFESLQDHLAHIQEARQAVNALREDHERKKQEKALEEQRIRQMQMQQKVDLMRQKKHESLLHQRHLALLRFQQQEQEMQMRRMQAQHVGPQPLSFYGMPAQGAQMSYATVDGATSLPVSSTADPASNYSVQGGQYQLQYGYSGEGLVDPSKKDFSANASVQVTHATAPAEQLAHQYGSIATTAQSQRATPVQTQPGVVQSYSSPEFNTVAGAQVMPNMTSDHNVYMSTAQQYPYQLSQTSQLPMSHVGPPHTVASAVDPSRASQTAFHQQQLPPPHIAAHVVAQVPVEQQQQQQQQQYYAHSSQMQFPPNQYIGYQTNEQATAAQMVPSAQPVVNQQMAQQYYQQQYQMQNYQYRQEIPQAAAAGRAPEPPAPSTDEGLLISFD